MIKQAEEVVDLIEAPEETNTIDITSHTAMEPVEPRNRGLFWLASKFIGNKPFALTSRGLFSLASKKAANNGKGLLALASEHKETASDRGKGLLAPAGEFEVKTNDFQDLIADIDVV